VLALLAATMVGFVSRGPWSPFVDAAVAIVALAVAELVRPEREKQG
jgi:hypothetical protein